MTGLDQQTNSVGGVLASNVINGDSSREIVQNWRMRRILGQVYAGEGAATLDMGPDVLTVDGQEISLNLEKQNGTPLVARVIIGKLFRPSP